MFEHHRLKPSRKRNWTYDLTLTFRIELRTHPFKLLLHLPLTELEIVHVISIPEMSINVFSLLLFPHLLTNIARSHIADNYANHLKVYTDGSVFKKGYYIFTEELCAVLMALSYLVDLP